MIRSNAAIWALAGLLAGSLGYNAVQHLQARRSAEVEPVPAPLQAHPDPSPGPTESPAGCCGDRAPGVPGGCRLERLELSPDQRAALETCCARTQDVEAASAAELRSELARLHVELRKETPDRTAVDGIVDRMCTAKRRMLEARVEAVLEVKGTLTKEQLKRLDEAALAVDER